MAITNGKVSFGRVVRPADFENGNATVEYFFVVDDGEDAFKLAEGALAEAKAQVLAAVGKSPKAAPDAVEDTVRQASEPAKEPAKPRGRGRGEGKDPMAETSEQEPAKEPAKEPATAKDPMADDDAPKGDARGGVVDLGAQTEEMDDATFHEAVKKHAARITGRVVKQMMADLYEVKQLGAVPKDKRQAFLTALANTKGE